MSDSLTKAGQARNSNAIIYPVLKDGAKLAKKLQKLEDGGETAIKRTVSDFKSSAPGWVKKGVKEHYSPDNAAFRDLRVTTRKGTASIKVAGKMIENAQIKYEGHLLTTTHFSQSPK